MTCRWYKEPTLHVASLVYWKIRWPPWGHRRGLHRSTRARSHCESVEPDLALRVLRASVQKQLLLAGPGPLTLHIPSCIAYCPGRAFYVAGRIGVFGPVAGAGSGRCSTILQLEFHAKLAVVIGYTSLLGASERFVAIASRLQFPHLAPVVSHTNLIVHPVRYVSEMAWRLEQRVYKRRSSRAPDLGLPHERSDMATWSLRCF